MVVRAVDQHNFYADPDPYSTSIMMQNPDQGPDPILSFTHVGKSGFFYSQLCQFTLFFISVILVIIGNIFKVF
jgi:hypothetical protein